MKYIVPLIVSLPVFIFPFVGNKSISWGIAVIIFGYFWVGIVVGQEIEKK